MPDLHAVSYLTFRLAEFATGCEQNTAHWSFNEGSAFGFRVSSGSRERAWERVALGGALADLGHEVTVLTTSRHRDEVLASRPQGVDFRFIDIPASPLPRSLELLGPYRVYRRWQDAALRHVAPQAQQYDVAHHVTWGGLHQGSMLWRLPIPLVYGPVGGGQTAPGEYWRYFGRDWPAEMVRTAAAGPFLKLIGRCRKTVQKSAVTLVNNSETAAACRRLGAADIRYMLADGLSTDWISDPRSQPRGTPVVLWVGRLLSRKAPTLAVEAFAELRQTMPARLIIVGDGPLREQVRATIKRLGLTQDVQMLGWVSWGDQEPVRFGQRALVHLVARVLWCAVH